MPRTVAVIPSFCSWANLERHLPPLLEELRPRGIEVVVSDDASPDDTADRVAASFPEVRLLYSGEGQFVAGWRRRRVDLDQGAYPAQGKVDLVELLAQVAC